MDIEGEARRLVTGAVQLEKNLTSIEVGQKAKGKTLMDSDSTKRLAPAS